MNFKKIRDYHVRELEEKAAGVLETHFGQSLAIPIDIDLIAEEMDVLIDTRPGLLEKKTPGMVWREHSGIYYIIIDEHVADYILNLYRFTVAEEIGHIILHPDVIDELDSEEKVGELLEWDGYHNMDYQAKRFGAALLMPPALITSSAERIYPKLVKEAKFGDFDAVKAWLSSILSKEFLVSQPAMTNRLSHAYPMGIYNRVDQSMMNKSDILLQSVV